MDAGVEDVARIEQEIGDGRNSRGHGNRLQFEDQIGIAQLEPGPEFGRKRVFALLVGVVLRHPEAAGSVSRFEQRAGYGHDHIALGSVRIEPHLGQGLFVDGEDEPGSARDEGGGVNVAEVQSGLDDFPAFRNGDGEVVVVHRSPELVILNRRQLFQGNSQSGRCGRIQKQRHHHAGHQ